MADERKRPAADLAAEIMSSDRPPTPHEEDPGRGGFPIWAGLVIMIFASVVLLSVLTMLYGD